MSQQSFAPHEAANLKIRSSLMRAIKSQIEANGWIQGEAAERLAVTEPRVSDLMRGKIDAFTVDALLAMAVNAGLKVDLTIIVLPADPNDPEDGDVTFEAIEKGLAERRERLRRSSGK